MTNAVRVKESFDNLKMTKMEKLISYFAPKKARSRAVGRWMMTHGGDLLAPLFGNSFDGASLSKTSMRGWIPSGGDADLDSIQDLPWLRIRSRDLYRNSPVGGGALKRIKHNVVGEGLFLQSRVDRKFLSLTDEQADDWERNTEREFELWAGSLDSDITRTRTFYDTQALAYLSTAMNGDCFVMLPTKKVKGNPYRLKTMLIEADQCQNPGNSTFNTNKIAGGIEIDDFHAPTAYWFRKTHPGAFFPDSRWERVPAFGSRTGRRNVLHLIEQERVNQRRGIPILAPVINDLKQITRMQEAEIMAAVISSFFTVFIEHDNAGGQLGPGIDPSQSVLDNTTADDKIYELGTGSMVDLSPGEKINIAESKRPNVNFDPFFMAIVKSIGANVGIPVDVLMLSFTKSYSASRGALLEAFKFFRICRVWLNRNFNQPIYKAWLEEAILIGRVDAPGFFDDPAILAAWAGSKWTGTGMGQIDPLKESKAAELRLKMKLSTREDEHITAGLGNQWEKTIERRAREETKLKELGLQDEPENPEIPVGEMVSNAIEENQETT